MRSATLCVLLATTATACTRPSIDASSDDAMKESVALMPLRDANLNHQYGAEIGPPHHRTQGVNRSRFGVSYVESNPRRYRCAV